jgi:hypothetical protein
LIDYARRSGVVCVGGVLSRLDATFANRRPWTGLITVDTLLHQGVRVIRVVPGSPAEQAGIQRGDVVLSLDSQPVKRTADLLSAVAAKKPGEKLVLQLRGGAVGSTPRTLELVVGETAREIPLVDQSLLYNKAMMDQCSIVEGYPGTEQAAYARLNLALCALHFSDYAGAHDYLQKAKNELPVRPGLSRGTALYYLGLTLARLGYRPQAIEAYKAAADVKDATLICYRRAPRRGRGSGTRLKPWARNLCRPTVSNRARHSAASGSGTVSRGTETGLLRLVWARAWQSRLPRGGASRSVLLLAWLGLVGPGAGADELSVRVDDIGLRRHLGHRNVVPLVVRLENAGAGSFDGELVARGVPDQYLAGDTPDVRVSSRVVSVPAHESRRVCVRAFDARTPVLLEAIDGQGQVRGSRSLDWETESLTRHSGQKLAGVLAPTAEVAQEVHRAVLFPRGAGLDAVAPPQLELVTLAPETLPPCLECYRELSFLVVATGPGALRAEQTRLLADAMLAGLQIVVAGDGVLEGFPFPVNEVRTGPVRYGLGSLERVASLDDPRAFARLRAAGSDERAEVLAALPPASAADALQAEAWTRRHFRRAQPPGRLGLACGLTAYLLLLGPVSFFFLRARDRREEAWLWTPAIAGVATVALVAWMSAHAFHRRELDVARFVYSTEGARLARQELHARLSTPRAESVHVRVEGPWTFDTITAPRVRFSDRSVELRDVHTQVWSVNDLSGRGSVAAPAPVVWRGEVVENRLPLAFSEAALLVGEDAFETGRIASGASWRFAEHGPSRALLTLVRSFVDREAAIDGAVLDAVAFDDADQMRRTMASARGLFLGVVERPVNEVLFEPRPAVARGSTVYVHLFPKEPAP